MNTYTVCLQSFRTRLIKNQNLKKPTVLPLSLQHTTVLPLYTYRDGRKASEFIQRPQM